MIFELLYCSLLNCQHYSNELEMSFDECDRVYIFDEFAGEGIKGPALWEFIAILPPLQPWPIYKLR